MSFSGGRIKTERYVISVTLRILYVIDKSHLVTPSKKMVGDPANIIMFDGAAECDIPGKYKCCQVTNPDPTPLIMV